MNPTLQSLGIERLSVDERLKLIGEIWESITESTDSVELSQAHLQDLNGDWTHFETILKLEHLGRGQGPIIGAFAVIRSLVVNPLAEDDLAEVITWY